MNRGSLNVMLVGHDPAVRDATRLLLKSDGYGVSAVSTLEEALEMANSTRIDLLVTFYYLRGTYTAFHVIDALRDKLKTSLGAVIIAWNTTLTSAYVDGDIKLRIASTTFDGRELLFHLRDLSMSDGNPDRQSLGSQSTQGRIPFSGMTSGMKFLS